MYFTYVTGIIISYGNKFPKDIKIRLDSGQLCSGKVSNINVWSGVDCPVNLFEVRCILT